MKYLILSFAVLVFSCQTNTTTSDEVTALDSLKSDLDSMLLASDLPGFAVSIFSQDSIYFQQGFGRMDIAGNKQYSSESVQCIASVSKTFIGVSLMMAFDQGKMNLDAPVNDYLPFEVTNKAYPNVPITLRMLANHTSSISDEGEYDKAYVFPEETPLELFPEDWHEYVTAYKSNQKESLSDFLDGISENLNYSEFEPGTNYDYSNIGSSLLALAIQNATGKPYDEFVRTEIWEPLGMTQTTWNPDEISIENKAIHYLENGNISPSYQLNTYPDGYAHSSVSDLTKFLQEMIKGHKDEGKLISKQAYGEMFSRPNEELPDAVCWDMAIPCCVGHAGNDFGTATMMFFERESGMGRILFTNKSLETDELNEQYYDIFNKLFEYQF